MHLLPQSKPTHTEASSNTLKFSNKSSSNQLVFFLPRTQGSFVHNCAHDHRKQGLLCTSAKAFASLRVLRAQQMSLPDYNRYLKNTQEPDEPGKSAMVVGVGQLMQNTPPRICIAPCPFSSQALCLQHRSETSPSP